MTDQTPEGHEIRKVWEDNAKLRTLDGTIELARDGDKNAIFSLMRAFNMKAGMYENDSNGNRIAVLERDPDRRRIKGELLTWIAEIFEQILKGENADVAFGLRPGPGGSRSKIDSKGREKRAAIACYILSNSSSDDRGSLKKAVNEAIQKFGTNRTEAYELYYAYKLD